MSIYDILKIDERKRITDELERYYANGGVVKKLPAPTCDALESGWLQAVSPKHRQALAKNKLLRLTEGGVAETTTHEELSNERSGENGRSEEAGSRSPETGTSGEDS